MSRRGKSPQPRCAALVLLNATLLPLTSASAAQPAVDPAVGSWTLNLAKSTLDPSEAGLKTVVRTYTATADGMTTSVHSVDASGAPQDTGTTFVYDGKRHPVSGPTQYDAVAVTRVNTYTARTELFRGGKVVGHLVRVVSKNGKSMTIRFDLATIEGSAIHDITVYDRQ
jgi:hypothetical protein